MWFGKDKSNGHSGVCECNECCRIENETEGSEEMNENKFTTGQVVFKLGQIVMTQGVNAMLADGLDAIGLVKRHFSGDWGDLCAEDKAANDFAVENNERILSAYNMPQGKVWIITEWDRSVTTLLLPSEY